MLIGLAIGEGTGPELAEVFEDALRAWAGAADVHYEVVRDARLYRTYGGFLARDAPANEVIDSCQQDTRAYETYLRELYARGGRWVFRTAFNAQPLYLVREHLAAVKVEALPNGEGEILLVRDQAQGFYAGDNDRHDPDRVTRTSTFSRATTERMLDFAVSSGRARWGNERPFTLVMAYKFHLLDRRFGQWVDAWSKDRGQDARVFQPDTMARNLQRGTWRGNVVIVSGNEVGDIMHADLILRAGLGSQDERCSVNHYLALPGLEELQTVHGSADDIAGKGTVNPTATLRAAAQILEANGVRGIADALENALLSARVDGIATRDVGGGKGTREVTRAVIEGTLAAWRSPTPRRDQALVVIDVQHDFLAPDGRFGTLGLVAPERVAAFVPGLRRAITAARDSGLPVFFVRTIANAELLPSTVVARHLKTGRAGWLRDGDRGAELYEVQAAPNDTVITKLGYDAFLGTDLEAQLRARGIRKLALVGVFTDLCVDAAARTAHSRGFEVSVVASATMPLERDADEVLAFMARFYNTTVVDELAC